MPTKSTGVGRGRKGIPRKLEIINGRKLCTGRLHRGGVWLPATTDYFYAIGIKGRRGFYSICKKCRRSALVKDDRKNFGYVAIGRMSFVFNELEQRLGRREAERRLGGSTHLMSRIMKGRQHYVEKETANRALELLRELRQHDVQRTEKEIKFGSGERRRDALGRFIKKEA